MKRSTALLSLTFLCLVYRAEAVTSKTTKAPAFTAGQLQSTAADFYRWREENFPVWSSEQGLHTFDARLTDSSAPALAKRRAHVAALLRRVRTADISLWSKDDQIDWILFRAQLERFDFDRRVLHPEETDPSRYVEEASTAIFSLLKKEYDAPAVRARSAMARFSAMPAMFADARKNLTAPVHLYAQLAIESARAIDPLFTDSVEPLRIALSESERAQFDHARDAAVRSAHDFADWLEKRLPSMPEWKPMGEANYNYLLHHVLLLPFDAREVATLGEVELARYRALESWLKNPGYASPDSPVLCAGGLWAEWCDDRAAPHGRAPRALHRQQSHVHERPTGHGGAARQFGWRHDSCSIHRTPELRSDRSRERR